MELNPKLKCTSCGDLGPCLKNNNSYVCLPCYRMDKRGTPRDVFGKIISDKDDTSKIKYKKRK